MKKFVFLTLCIMLLLGIINIKSKAAEETSLQEFSDSFNSMIEDSKYFSKQLGNCTPIKLTFNNQTVSEIYGKKGTVCHVNWGNKDCNIPMIESQKMSSVLVKTFSNGQYKDENDPDTIYMKNVLNKYCK